MSNNKNKYDLEERTNKFGSDVVILCKEIKQDAVTRPLISQLIRSATSIGANYCEADGAESKKDFKHKVGICKKESKETKHWLKIMQTAVPEQKEKLDSLYQEAKELTLIFSAIINKT